MRSVWLSSNVGNISEVGTCRSLFLNEPNGPSSVIDPHTSLPARGLVLLHAALIFVVTSNTYLQPLGRHTELRNYKICTMKPLTFFHFKFTLDIAS